MNGFFAVWGNTPYAISKFGVEALSEALRYEIDPLGCHVAVIEPGGVYTGCDQPLRVSVPSTPHERASCLHTYVARQHRWPHASVTVPSGFDDARASCFACI